MSSSFRPRAAARMDSDLDAALDYLGYNPLEDVPFQLNPVFLPPTDLLRRTEELLAAPVPGQEALAAGRWNFDGAVERQVIEQLRVLDEAKRQREERESEALREFAERKRRERELAEEEAAKRRQRELEEAEELRKARELEERQAEETALRERERRAAAAAAKEEREHDGLDAVEAAEVGDKVQQVDKPASAPPPHAPQPPCDGMSLQNGLGNVNAAIPQMRGLTITEQPPATQLGQNVLVRGTALPPMPTLAGRIGVPPMRLAPVPPNPANMSVHGLNKAPPLRAPAPLPLSSAAANPNINFSEFEAESDPFESLELKSINDFQALASVLQTTSPLVPSSSSAHSTMPQQQQQGHSVYTRAQSRPNVSQAAQISQLQHQMRSPIPQQSLQQQQRAAPSAMMNQPGRFPQMRYQGFPTPAFGGYGHQQVPTFSASPQVAQPRTSSSTTSYQPPYPTRNVNLPPNYHPVTNPYGIPARSSSPGPDQAATGLLKGSKSYGDIVGELKNEERKKALTSVTPPPRVANVGPAVKGLEDWVPWPDLDKEGRGGAPAPAAAEPDPLLSLSSEQQRQLCRQVHEMGFPMSRVVRVCQALGDDGQKIIHFCLLVDKLKDEVRSVEEIEVEHILLMKSMHEEECRKHLKAFARLKDLGFESRAIHDALEECHGNHEKALEHLLK